jgi:hypothetical protein
MSTMVEINGIAHPYGEGISSLEGMLAFMRMHCIPREEVVVEVKVDGEIFSEAYRNQARQIPLAEVSKIEIVTQTGKAFAWGFMAEAPRYIGHLQRGFESAIRLLRDPYEEGEGYQMLAKSLETLLAFKSHFDNVIMALQESGRTQTLQEFWTTFKDAAESILEAQEQMDSASLASQLETELIPRLEEWKQTVVRLGAQ